MQNQEDKFITIDGVVSSEGIYFNRSRSSDNWTFLLRLCAWAGQDGLVSSSVYRLKRQFSSIKDIQTLAEQLKPCSPVKLLVSDTKQIGDLDEHGFCVGTFNEYVGESNDESVINFAENMEVPCYHEDKILGKLLLDDSNYEITLLWRDVSIHLSLGEWEGSIDPDCLAVGHHLVQNVEEWEAKWRTFALEHIYDPTDEWYQEGVDWTPEAFIEELGYPTISCDDGDSFIFFFDGGRLFGEHCVVVGGSIANGFTDWSIAG